MTQAYEYGALKAWALEIVSASPAGISLKALREKLNVKGIQRQCEALINEGLIVRRDSKANGALYFPKAARKAAVSKTAKAQGRKPKAKKAKADKAAVAAV